MSNIIVDCEALGGAPSVGQLTEFGAVDFDYYVKTGRWNTFHGTIVESKPDPNNPAIPMPVGKPDSIAEYDTYVLFEAWLRDIKKGRHTFWSDNVAYDWQWINDGFWRTLQRNPFGFSGRRIGDFYAGLTGDLQNTQLWKRMRVTPHTHNPVEDAKGNAEALARILKGER